MWFLDIIRLLYDLKKNIFFLANHKQHVLNVFSAFLYSNSKFPAFFASSPSWFSWSTIRLKKIHLEIRHISKRVRTCFGIFFLFWSVGFAPAFFPAHVVWLGGVFVVVWWCFCGGVCVVMFLWWCGWVVFLWWCFCGGVFVVVWLGVFFFVVVFLCFCGVFVVFLWWCFSGAVLVVVFLWCSLWWCFWGWCFCGGVFVVVWLGVFCGGVFVFLWWCFCGVFVVVF